jgi:hypothetical protein
MTGHLLHGGDIHSGAQEVLDKRAPQVTRGDLLDARLPGSPAKQFVDRLAAHPRQRYPAARTLAHPAEQWTGLVTAHLQPLSQRVERSSGRVEASLLALAGAPQL